MKAKIMILLGFFMVVVGCGTVMDFVTDTTPTYREAQDTYDYWQVLHAEICTEPTEEIRANCEKYGESLKKIKEKILDPWGMAIEMSGPNQEEYEKEFVKIKQRAALIVLRELMKE